MIPGLLIIFVRMQTVDTHMHTYTHMYVNISVCMGGEKKNIVKF